MITACSELSIDEHRSFDDSVLVGTMLWKLGFQLNETQDVSKRFWQLHEKMKQVTQTAGVSAIVDQEAVRALASNYFVLLEQVLDDSLAFSAWALTTDHVASATPYTYRGEDDRVAAFAVLDEHEQARDSGPEVIRYSDKNALYELSRGFASLADLLRDMREHRDDYKRGIEDVPRYVKHTDLKVFPFKHKAAFLDLVDSSQARIGTVLRDATHGLIAADVNGVRNDQLHFRRSTADLGRLSACLTAVETAVGNLEQAGLTRLLFHPKGEQADEWDRRIFLMIDPRGREIAFARPSSYDWLRLPGLKRPQYLMTAAVFAEPNEILRFRGRYDSDFADLWDDFPKRRQIGQVSQSGAGTPENSSPAASEL